MQNSCSRRTRLLERGRHFYSAIVKAVVLAVVVTCINMSRFARLCRKQRSDFIYLLRNQKHHQQNQEKHILYLERKEILIKYENIAKVVMARNCMENLRRIKWKVKKVVTYCGHCEGEPHMCLNGFNTTHKQWNYFLFYKKCFFV